ncbi:MAG: hypothetical protein M1834_008717 [Cirrosporium novae-zelandiae]|nr:MAG: hypothetical protein M1834_008717 [Cirrosporium novae-zelandiae]
MGFFSSGPKPGTPEAPKATHDGAYIAPDRSKRAHCWEARDIYFGCLTKNNIIDSIKEKDNADRLCSKESQQFDKDCATSWVTYFKKRRVMEHQRELTLKKLHAEGAQGLEAAR